MRFYVYVLLDPRKPGRFDYDLPCGKVARFDHEPFYVGKGCGDRLNWHVRAAKRGSATHKDNRIRSILNSGHDVIVKKCRGFFPEADAFRIERELIACIGRRGVTAGPLTNLTDGGEGAAGVIHPPRTSEARNKMRAAKLGGTLTIEHRMNIRLAGIGRVHSEESKALMRAAVLGKKRSLATRLLIGLRQQGQTRAALSEDTKRKIALSHSALTLDQVLKVEGLLAEGFSQRALAKQFGVSQPVITRINKGLNPYQLNEGTKAE